MHKSLVRTLLSMKDLMCFFLKAPTLFLKRVVCIVIQQLLKYVSLTLFANAKSARKSIILIQSLPIYKKIELLFLIVCLNTHSLGSFKSINCRSTQKKKKEKLTNNCIHQNAEMSVHIKLQNNHPSIQLSRYYVVNKQLAKHEETRNPNCCSSRPNPLAERSRCIFVLEPLSWFTATFILASNPRLRT